MLKQFLQEIADNGGSLSWGQGDEPEIAHIAVDEKLATWSSGSWSTQDTLKLTALGWRRIGRAAPPSLLGWLGQALRGFAARPS